MKELLNDGEFCHCDYIPKNIKSMLISKTHKFIAKIKNQTIYIKFSHFSI